MTTDPTELVRQADADFDQTVAEVQAAATLAELAEVRARRLGRTRGTFVERMKLLGTLPPDQRPTAGQHFNQLKARYETLFETREAELNAASTAGPVIDLTMPARHGWRGGRHPVTLVIDE